MFRFSALVLALLLVFGVVFSLLPSGPDVARSGVTLKNVQLSLYPEQDPGAVWRFRAATISVDPLKSENTLDGLGRGERWLRRADGSETLDMTLRADKLVIDGDSNLSTQQAQMYILQDCTTLTMRSVGSTPILINQRSGYSAPYVGISSPSIHFEYDNFSSPFDLSNVRGDQRAGGTLQPDPSTTCRNGRIVPKASAASAP
ncbi:hypothetical protein [Deinococcus ruber]|uniref:hypothetical protein n=1 Tax=Deinococcus ruber TaxID=1848197 RepID=UPI0016641C41|nr:hypothetical protein [Deinococcus ruber]